MGFNKYHTKTNWTANKPAFIAEDCPGTSCIQNIKIGGVVAFLKNPIKPEKKIGSQISYSKV